jgi:hypothetical protein
MPRLRQLTALALLPLLAGMAEAQRAPDGSGRLGGPRREQMEQQLRRNLWQIAKQRIGLSDAQMTQLQRTSQRFDVRRRELAQDERAQRQLLRRELLTDANPNQDAVAKALDRLHLLQRQRVDLLIEEQREFATFMTPVQRAKYAALQEQVRRRVDALRRQRPDSAQRPRRP